jgi:ribosome-binding factor A
MSNRLIRVNELLQREISAFLHQRYSAESVAITITGVQITGDLREARIYYSVLGEKADAVRAGKWLLGKRNEIRETVAKKVILRHVPLLTFVHDNHAPRTLRIEELLGKIDQADKKP